MRLKACLKTLGLLLMAILCLALAAGCSSDKTATNNMTPASPTTAGSQSPASSNGSSKDTAGYGAAGASADKELSMEKMLVYAIQDEYLARGEYEYVLNKFGDQRPFSNIIKSEEQHIAELKVLFEKYKLAVPEDTSKNHLVPASTVEEALGIGVQAEIDNIVMYNSFLSKDLPDDVKSTFNFLMSGSENHLEAFQKNLDK